MTAAEPLDPERLAAITKALADGYLLWCSRWDDRELDWIPATRDMHALLAEVERLQAPEQRIRDLLARLRAPDRYIVDNTGVSSLILNALDGGAS